MSCQDVVVITPQDMFLFVNGYHHHVPYRIIRNIPYFSFLKETLLKNQIIEFF